MVTFKTFEEIWKFSTYHALGTVTILPYHTPGSEGVVQESWQVTAAVGRGGVSGTDPSSRWLPLLQLSPEGTAGSEQHLRLLVRAQAEPLGTSILAGLCPL